MKDLLDIDCLPLSDFQTNCYIVRPAGENEAWVFDPGIDPAPLLERLRELELSVTRILLTHGHADHIAGVGAVKAAFPSAVITAPLLDAEMLTDPWKNLSATFGFPLTCPPAEQLVRAGETLAMGEIRWRVLDTAGHTPGGVSFYCEAAGVAIVGDALFAGSVGRCDFPGSNYEQLINNIQRHLLSLPEDTRVLSGHGPSTTVGEEKHTNPYLT